MQRASLWEYGGAVFGVCVCVWGGGGGGRECKSNRAVTVSIAVNFMKKIVRWFLLLQSRASFVRISCRWLFVASLKGQVQA